MIKTIQIGFEVLFQNSKKVIIIRPLLKDWIKGAMITCQKCGKVEIVVETSLCDEWKLCKDCASQKVEQKLRRNRR